VREFLKEVKLYIKGAWKALTQEKQKKHWKLRQSKKDKKNKLILAKKKRERKAKKKGKATCFLAGHKFTMKTNNYSYDNIYINECERCGEIKLVEWGQE
jgi:hypothetical protein